VGVRREEAVEVNFLVKRKVKQALEEALPTK
jgi:hypothetical protein